MPLSQRFFFILAERFVNGATGTTKRKKNPVRRDESVDKDWRKDLQKSSQVMMMKFLRVPRLDGDGDNRVVFPFVPVTDNTDTAPERAGRAIIVFIITATTKNTFNTVATSIDSKTTDLPDVFSQPSSSSSRQSDEHLHYGETEYAALTKKDVGYIKFDVHCDKPKISDDLRVQMVKMSAKAFQNKDGPFKVTNYQEGIERRCAEEAMRSETNTKRVCVGIAALRMIGFKENYRMGLRFRGIGCSTPLRMTQCIIFAVHCFQRLQSTKVRYSKNRVDFANGKNATKEFQNMKRVSITVHHFLHGKILRDAYQKGLRLTK